MLYNFPKLLPSHACLHFVLEAPYIPEVVHLENTF
jgi:hypothetical protein